MKSLNFYFAWVFTLLFCGFFSLQAQQSCNPADYDALALNWTPTATNNSNSAERVFDGVVGNVYWEGGYGQIGDWFKVDMKTPTVINQIILAFRSASDNDYPHGIAIDISDTDNGGDWQEIYSSAVTNDNGQFVVDLPANPETRYFRIRLTAVTQYYWGFSEIYVKVVEDNCLVPVCSNPKPEIVSAMPDYTSVALTLSPQATATSNTLYRSTSAASKGTLLTDYDGSATTFTDSGLAEGTTYYYTLVSDFSDCNTEHSLKVTTKADVILPPQPFVPETSFTCNSCPSGSLLGFTAFLAEDGVLNNNNIYYKNPSETFTINPLYSTNGTLTNNTYAIAKNPADAKDPGGQALLNDAGLKNGIFLVRPDGSNVYATYKITGLNTRNSSANASDWTYCVRIKMRNPGGRGCSNTINNIIQFRALNGNAISGGGVSSGQWKRTDTSGCTAQGTTGTWDGNNNNYALRSRGYITTYEVNFQLGQNPNNTNDDGFMIYFSATGADGNDVLGIESIEVWGCAPKKITAENASGNETTTFCENSPFKLTASGAGFGDDIKWYSGTDEQTAINAAMAGTNFVGTGSTFESKAPIGVGAIEWYVAKGSLGYESIAITSVFCCPNTVTVFTEDFPLNPATSTSCNNGQVTISSLSPGRGSTTYNFFSDCAAISAHAQAPYAVVTSSNLAPWNTRTIVRERTGTAGSGALLVNAAADTNQYFYELELPICSATTYSFSAWYVSIANAGAEAPSNIRFEIWETDANGTPTIIIPGGASDTGNFGGTSNDVNTNSSFIWRQHTLDFTTPVNVNAGTRYVLRLKNHNGATDGNDLMIDDILVTKCMPNINIESGGQIGGIVTCSTVGIDLQLNAAQSDLNIIASGNLSGNIYYQWAEVAENGDLVALIGSVQELAPTVVATVTTPPTVAGETRYYQVKISSDPLRAADWTANLATSCGNDVKSIIFKAEIESGDHIAGSTADERCGEGTVNLIATTSPAGGTVNWYDVEKNGTPIGQSTDGVAWPTPVISETKTFYAELDGGTCPTGRTPVVATVKTVNTIAPDGDKNRKLCVNTALETNIVFNTTGATALTAPVSGLPAGMSGVFMPSDAAVFPPQGTVTISGTPTENGTFNYTIDISNDCGTVTESGTITVIAVPTLTAISAPAPVCDGGNLELTAPTITDNGSTIGAQGWEIETAAGSDVYVPFSNPVTRADNGKLIRYFVEVICGRVPSNSVLVTINAAPTVTALITPDAVCAGNNLTMTANVSNNNGSTITGYSWKLNGVEIGTEATLNYPMASAHNNQTLILTVMSSCGDVSTAGVTVTVNDKPAAAEITAPATVCSGNNLELPIWNDPGYWQIETSAGSNSFVAFNSPFTVVDADNGKLIRYARTNDCGTSYSNEVKISVNPVPAVNALSPQTICSGTGTDEVILSSIPTGAMFSWTVQSTGVSGASDGSGTSIPATELYATGNAQGQVIYSITPTLNACTGPAANFTVYVNPIPPAPGVTPVTYCVGAVAVPLTAAGSNLQWFDAGGNLLDGAPTPSTDAEGVTPYRVSQTVSGCESPRAELLVTIIEAMQIKIIAQNESGATLANNTSAIKRGVNLVVISVSGDAPKSYVWSWDNMSQPDDNEIWVYPMKTTTYNVVARIDNSCSATAEITINVTPLPNAFVPSLGQGDKWSVFPVGADAADQQVIKYKSLIVYNRYGQEVYKGNEREPWNGKLKGGKLAEPGTYFYVITFDDGETLKGTVEIVK